MDKQEVIKIDLEIPNDLFCLMLSSLSIEEIEGMIPGWKNKELYEQCKYAKQAIGHRNANPNSWINFTIKS